MPIKESSRINIKCYPTSSVDQPPVRYAFPHTINFSKVLVPRTIKRSSTNTTLPPIGINKDAISDSDNHNPPPREPICDDNKDKTKEPTSASFSKAIVHHEDLQIYYTLATSPIPPTTIELQEGTTRIYINPSDADAKALSKIITMHTDDDTNVQYKNGSRTPTTFVKMIDTLKSQNESVYDTLTTNALSIDPSSKHEKRTQVIPTDGNSPTRDDCMIDNVPITNHGSYVSPSPII